MVASPLSSNAKRDIASGGGLLDHYLSAGIIEQLRLENAEEFGPGTDRPR